MNERVSSADKVGIYGLLGEWVVSPRKRADATDSLVEFLLDAGWRPPHRITVGQPTLMSSIPDEEREALEYVPNEAS